MNIVKVKCAIVAMMASVPVLVGAPAHAADFGEPLVYNGTWKAYGSFDDSSGRMCVRVYNSPEGSSAQMYMRLEANRVTIGYAEDQGGDNSKMCDSIPDRYEDRRVEIQIVHIGSGGTARDAVFNNRVI